MTAQVAILNERCAAVASDSVMTIGTGDRQRTIQTADKIFEVGADHRVVVLNSGSAKFMNVPYEVLVTEWKRTVAEPLPTVTHYAKSFVAWLGQQDDLFTADEQRSLLGWMARDYYLSVRSALIEQLRLQGLGALPWDDREVASLVDETVGTWLRRLGGRAELVGVDPGSDAAWVAAHDDVVREAFEYVFDDVPRTVGSDRRLLEEVPALLVGRAEPWDVDATIAFIGYGSREVFPGHQVIDLTGILNGDVRLDWWEELRVTLSNRAVITPFAQAEAINTFLRAYNADFLDCAHRRLDAAVDAAGGIAAERRAEAHTQLTDEFDRLSWDRFVNPMLRTIEVLPRLDMARMADALVGIQALRAASGDKQPTVGGPIDVVVVSREHGVEWIRRKDGSNW